MKTQPATSPHTMKPSGLPTKSCIKTSNMPTSPLAQPANTPAITEDRPELLGSLTTQQQQRTSARVIKKLRLDDAAADREKKDITECESTLKHEDKEKMNTVKQRMPKALWSADEKNLFFEALNEYGKDFDAITTYICVKMKKKGVNDSNIKNKHQVSHFYYRTWHKLSKHVHFNENVKKVAQELYALINYGELRKKLPSVKEKTCARLGEMVASGGLVVRARGRNVRVRTPTCRALRRLNHISEGICGPRVCSRAMVSLRARDAAAWARVQAAAHNPRVAVSIPLRTELVAFLRALQKRWRGRFKYSDKEELIACDDTEKAKVGDDNIPEHLNLDTDRLILKTKKLALHIGPKPDTDIHFPIISPAEQLSSQKICFSSYLERMGRGKAGCPPKNRMTKRQRKDSITEKELEQKKIKMEDAEHRLMNIDETAIDGIELMASLSEKQLDEEKPGTETEDLTEDQEIQDKDSFSEMEDDEKYNKSDTDNESDKCDKHGKFNPLKVKFVIRSKKQGGTSYSLVNEQAAKDNQNVEDPPKSIDDKDNKSKLLDEQAKTPDGQVKTADGHVKAADGQIKTADGQAKTSDEQAKTSDEQAKATDDKINESADEKAQPEFDLDHAIKQVRTGWSIHDAGQLTIGDLYLMFGSRSKLELDYWWGEPSPPILKVTQQKTKQVENGDKDKILVSDKIKNEKMTPDKESSEDDRDKFRESDNEMFSPKNVFNQDSNDGLSGDERKNELASPEHKGSRVESLRIADKLLNRPRTVANDHRAIMTERLKRLLSLASGIDGRCSCASACHIHRRKPSTTSERQGDMDAAVFRNPNAERQGTDMETSLFRHPVPIGPKTNDTKLRSVEFLDLPRLKRGRPRRSQTDERAVVVQRLLPLQPKQTPPSNNIIPIKVVTTTTPAPTKILPKPTAVMSNSPSSYVYLLSENGGQYYTHNDPNTSEPIGKISSANSETIMSTKNIQNELSREPTGEVVAKLVRMETVKTDSDALSVSGFLNSDSLQLSPSRLLRREGDQEGSWLGGDVQDFSLSSFLAHLDHARPSDIPIDSQLQSLMTESSVDYVAKFADLAAEVTGPDTEGKPL